MIRRVGFHVMSNAVYFKITLVGVMDTDPDEKSNFAGSSLTNLICFPPSFIHYFKSQGFLHVGNPFSGYPFYSQPLSNVNRESGEIFRDLFIVFSAPRYRSPLASVCLRILLIG